MGTGAGRRKWSAEGRGNGRRAQYLLTRARVTGLGMCWHPEQSGLFRQPRWYRRFTPVLADAGAGVFLWPADGPGTAPGAEKQRRGGQNHEKTSAGRPAMAMAAHRQHRPPIHSPNPTKENRYEKVCKHRFIRRFCPHPAGRLRRRPVPVSYTHLGTCRS